jgi:hypothetical protein
MPPAELHWAAVSSWQLVPTQQEPVIVPPVV